MDHRDHNVKEDIPPFLKDLKTKSAGYRIPGDYFAKMQANVLDQVLDKESLKETAWHERLIHGLQLWMQPQYALIGVVAMVLLGILINHSNSSMGDINSFAGLDEADLEYFMENEMEDLDDQDIMATLSADGFDLDNFNIPIVHDKAGQTIPEYYIEDLDNTTLIDFELED